MALHARILCFFERLLRCSAPDNEHGYWQNRLDARFGSAAGIGAAMAGLEHAAPRDNCFTTAREPTGFAHWGVGGTAMKFVMAALLLVALPAAAKVPAALAITFDDLPVHGPLPPGETRVQIGDALIAAMHDAGAGPVYGFVNEAQAEKYPDAAPMLDRWRAAGLQLGNHSWSHADLDKVDSQTYANEIVRNEPVLAAKMPAGDWRWFRFPYLHEGQDSAKRAAVRAELAKRGYHIAAVTMSFGDYMWNEPYARCLAAGDTRAVAWLEQSYLNAAHESAALSRAQSQAAYGRDIPYVLLMHVGAFDARMLPRLLAQYRAEGFRFASLPDAESDPAYAADVNPALPPAPTLEQRAKATKRPLPAVTRYGPKLDALCRGSAAMKS
jgi:peptidoglycan/xylan/chitin deacetylase (PgdA/CDA1 family)